MKEEKGIFARAAGSKTPWLFSLLLGATGFLSGFAGGILWDTSSNLAPINGLIIGAVMAGPLSAALGWALGLAIAIHHPKPTTTIRICFVSVLAITATTLLLCLGLREGSLYAKVLDAEILSCEPPSALIEKAKARWLEEQRNGLALRPGWDSDTESIAKMLADDRGAVVTLRVYRILNIYEKGQPWNPSVLVAKPWSEKDIALYSTGQYFLRYDGAPEEACKLRIRHLYFVKLSLPQVDSNPPKYLPEFLFLYYELGDVPAELRPLIDGTAKRVYLKPQ